MSDVTAEGCKLKWDKPEDDGGEPVDHYVIERMDVDTGRWVPCGTSKTPEADVSGLNEGKDYQFRVKAVNSEGESEPLETSIPTTAKNPYCEYIFCLFILFIAFIIESTINCSRKLASINSYYIKYNLIFYLSSSCVRY